MKKSIQQNISNPTFWNDLYEQKKDKWNLNSPTPAFVEWENNNKSNDSLNICIPGCGTSEDVLYFANSGYNVYAFDFSKYATDYLINKTKNLNLNINIMNVDFFTIQNKYKDFFDIILEYTFFCAIHPCKREKYIDVCSKILKNNGRFVGIFLPLKDVEDNNPPFTVSIDEVLKQFSHSFYLQKKYYPVNSVGRRKGNEIFVEFIKR